MFLLNQAQMVVKHGIIQDFNTSHVSIKLLFCLVTFECQRISIHPMFLLNINHNRILSKKCNFNTSHVSIKPPPRKSIMIIDANFNTSHVSIKLIQIFSILYGDLNFNTSHVSIKQEAYEGPYFQFCISIHPMFLLN